jgi:hypothetical protein
MLLELIRLASEDLDIWVVELVRHHLQLIVAGES